MRSPFSLLEDDVPVETLEIKSLERERIQHKSVRKSINLPFAKYEIASQSRISNAQTSKQKETRQKEKISPVKKSGQQKGQVEGTQKSKQVLPAQKGSKQQESPSAELAELKKTESITESEYTQQEEQKKYFLKKKHRQVKYELNADGDPPLLYGMLQNNNKDIGLDVDMIKDKLGLVIKMGQPDYDMIMNPDLAGPVIIAFAFGFLLLFSGQIHFGDIYALFIIGNLVMFVLFNFMARKGVISLYNIMSILGYCLMPMLTLGLAGIFFQLNNGLGLVFGLVISLWSSVAGGNFIDVLLMGKKNRRILIIYPLFLFYANFAMIVIF